MSKIKIYVREQELRVIFDSQFADKKWNEKPWIFDFQDWVVKMLEEGEIELVEFNYYAVSDSIIKQYLGME